MIYTKEKTNNLVEQLYTISEKYSNYYGIKETLNIENINDKIWSKGDFEPFCCDYITELFDNTYIPRKIMKTPKKKEYVKLHFFNNNIPVYSVSYGKDEDIVCEKIYISSQNNYIGLMFNSKSHNLNEVSLTTFDDYGYPIEHSRMRINTNQSKDIFGVVYNYENGLIVKAECIDSFNPEEEVVLYKDANIKTNKMNPRDVKTYIFNYENNSVKTFTRIDYEYGNEYQNTWKIRRGVIKNYLECGIKLLGE